MGMELVLGFQRPVNRTGSARDEPHTQFFYTGINTAINHKAHHTHKLKQNVDRSTIKICVHFQANPIFQNTTKNKQTDKQQQQTNQKTKQRSKQNNNKNKNSDRIAKINENCLLMNTN